MGNGCGWYFFFPPFKSKWHSFLLINMSDSGPRATDSIVKTDVEKENIMYLILVCLASNTSKIYIFTCHTPALALMSFGTRKHLRHTLHKNINFTVFTYKSLSPHHTDYCMLQNWAKRSRNIAVNRETRIKLQLQVFPHYVRIVFVADACPRVEIEISYPKLYYSIPK
jgi:hypothetical protein